jgi:hypothetical protein
MVYVQPMEELRMIIQHDGRVWVDDHGPRHDRNDKRHRPARGYDRHYR